MKSTTRFFVKAVVLAVVLSGAGYGYEQHKRSNTATLQRKCEAESHKEMDAFNARQKGQTGPWSMYQSAGMSCDPSALYADTPYGVVPPGVQGELLTAYRAQDNGIEKACYGLALLVMLIGTAPAIWYFFLARLGEVAAAVRRS